VPDNYRNNEYKERNMADDIPVDPTSRYGNDKQDDSYSTDNKCNIFSDKSTRTSRIRKQNSPTSHAMGCTPYRIPMYTDVDSNICLSMDDIASLFRKQ
jgi:hypothetical protein